MSERFPPRTRTARLLLVLAALLYFGGASAGPWVHALGVAEAASTSGSSQREAPEKKAAHDELACAVCQVLDAQALPGAEPSLRPGAVARAPLPEIARSEPPARSASSPRARAPPTA